MRIKHAEKLKQYGSLWRKRIIRIKVMRLWKLNIILFARTERVLYVKNNEPSHPFGMH